MRSFDLIPTHKPVQNYHEVFRQFDGLRVSDEGAVDSSFQVVLDRCAHQCKWPDLYLREIWRPSKRPPRADGVLLDHFCFYHGFWKARDTGDDPFAMPPRRSNSTIR